MAAYLDAGSALRIDPAFEKEVTFSFALRKSPDQNSPVLCRKEVRVCGIVFDMLHPHEMRRGGGGGVKG